jgi:peptide/nickel transport system ATP-binding protein
MVMSAGRMAELGSSEDIFGSPPQSNPSDSRSESQNGPPCGPLHPYTQKLLASTPRLHRRVSELAFIPGSPPDLLSPPPGCRFAPRCSFAKERCRVAQPPAVELGAGHFVACWKAMEDAEYGRE